MGNEPHRIVALAGGVGGAKLAHGLYQSLPPDALTVVVNTADDFVHWALHISPDLDTVMYTLAGIANEATGWGVADETWSALTAIGRLGGETWFRIGDQDLATHIRRTEALRSNGTLTDVTLELSRALGIRARLLPMSDARVMTMVETTDGLLAFQDYFVRRGHRDQVVGIRLDGIERAAPTAQVVTAIQEATAIVLCPSNPIVSIGPILALPGLRPFLTGRDVPRVAISPLVGGKALRGPADTMMTALGHESSALGVARLYQGLITGMVIDHADAAHERAIRALGMDVLVTDTIMHSLADRRRLAADVLQWCGALAG